MLIDLLIASLALGVIVLLLPWRPWATTETLEADPGDAADLSDVTVLIPARNEAGTIGETLHGLARQGPGLRIIVVDDQSDDGTAAAARGAGIEVLTVVAGATALTPTVAESRPDDLLRQERPWRPSAGPGCGRDRSPQHLPRTPDNPA